MTACQIVMTVGDGQAAEKFASNSNILLEIPCIFLYLAYIQCKVLEEAHNCAAAVLYRSHPATVMTPVIFKLTACQTVILKMTAWERHDGQKIAKSPIIF